MNDWEELNLRLHSLVVFRHLLEDPALCALSELLCCGHLSPLEQIDRYSAFAALLYRENGNLTDYLLERVWEDENIYVYQRSQNRSVHQLLEECVQNELKILEDVSRLTSTEIRKGLAFQGYLPQWQIRTVDFPAEYEKRMRSIASVGYGVYAKHCMFSVQDGGITPIPWPDTICLADLCGYCLQRQAVLENTLALLEGRPAANVLLYGDAGTGKSSTVKALVNAYCGKGLRLVEIRKNQFQDIPMVIESLAQNPLKFILFIDDLSFVNQNDDFNALKAVLEGSAAAKAANLVIYATSNRRHLVKESFSDRDSDALHPNETIQELASLSERFGLSVGFFKPDRESYLEIVRAIAARYGLKTDNAELETQAERYALERGGRSPRVARQFVEHLKAGENRR